MNIAAIIATGHPAGAINQGATDEEFEKSLGSVLLAGVQVIAIDNCTRPVGGALLSQL